jgi:cytochrome c oxidase cbb3-type subunit 3
MKKIVLVLSLLLVAGTIYVGSTLGLKEDTQNQVLAREGEKMYTQMCAACHGKTGLGEGKFSGTALNNQQFLSSVSDEDLFNYIKFGRVEAYMPEYGSVLKEEEIRKLTAFVRSWQQKKLTNDVPDQIAGNPGNGKKLYGLYCLSCHGESGQGKKGMGTALGNQEYLTYTSDQQIWIATAYGRDETRMGPSLKGLEGVRQLKKQDISDITSYIRGLKTK